MLNAALFTTKVMLTGVLLLVPSAKNNHLVRVIAPNGSIQHLGLPTHVSYVMFNIDNWDPSGRKPDFFVSRPDPNDPTHMANFGVCEIDKEYLEATGSFTQSPLCQPTPSSFALAPCNLTARRTDQAFPSVINENLVTNQDSLQWLFDFSRANPDIASHISDDVLQVKPATGKASLRMDLKFGEMRVLPNSFDLHYAYRLTATGTCQALARAVVVNLENSQDPSTLTLTSTSFSGSVTQLPLKLSASTGDLAVLIGNEPLESIPMSVDFLLGDTSSQHHEDTTDHQQRIRDLLSGLSTLITPAEIPAGACQNGHAPRIKTGAAGGGGTCNPGGTPPTDPSGG
ncbi:MAG TPA: hypothetical protein VNN25_17865 [Thermoanaerobaculia bacterium]|nr:hypothetical protein [Thermoanaerobaculia bacterium]